MSDDFAKTDLELSCPDWAKEQITLLREVEVYLGNIPRDKSWQSSMLTQVAKRALSSEFSSISEATADLIFAKIVKGLRDAGFISSQIEKLINSGVSYSGGPAYCNNREVELV